MFIYSPYYNNRWYYWVITHPYTYTDFCCSPAGCWSERTEVHKAASLGQASQLQDLIQSGASVNVVAVDSITPLHEACLRGQTQCVRLLLDAGAQVSQGRRTDLPYHGWLLWRTASFSRLYPTQLLHFIHYKYSTIRLTTVLLWLHCSGQTKTKNKSKERYRKELLDKLSEWGEEIWLCGKKLKYFYMSRDVSQVDARNVDGSTPLCDACSAGSLECVRLLLEHGAKANPALTSRTASPLHEACMGGECLSSLHISLTVIFINKLLGYSILLSFFRKLRLCEAPGYQGCLSGGIWPLLRDPAARGLR